VTTFIQLMTLVVREVEAELDARMPVPEGALS